MSSLIEKTRLHNACDLHYWVGKGTSDRWLVFLHGAGVDHRMFEEQVKAFSGEYNLLLWDARGHGASQPMGIEFSMAAMQDDLELVLQEEGIDSAIFIGQSMGGNLAQEKAYRSAKKMDGLILIDCTCNTNRLTASEKLSLWMTPFIFKLYPWKTLVRQSADACSYRVEVRRYIADCFRTLGKEAFVKILLQSTLCLHEDTTYRIEKPFLLLCGDGDPTGNIRKIAKAWADREPNCSFHWIENASHNSNQDNPLQVNAFMKEFIQSIYKPQKENDKSIGGLEV